MDYIAIFAAVYAAMISWSFAESSFEGRNSWDKGKIGFKIKMGKFIISRYHLFAFFITFPLLLALPLIIYGWNIQLFGILVSAYMTGLIIEDFVWYLVNPAVKPKEFWTSFSDYYPWIKIGKRKIIPAGYIMYIVIALLSWWFLWR
jgi:hypothetical protein